MRGKYVRKSRAKKVFHYFEEISKIPRGSYNEQRISDYLVGWAKERNLDVTKDSLNNAIIVKEATAGYENRDGFIIQGHMDMVIEQEEGCHKDMANEGTLVAGCAGGERINIDYNVKRAAIDYVHILINISGLLGGHSGEDINKSRASSFTLMVTIIQCIANETDLRIVRFNTGRLVNVIFNSATIELAVSDYDKCVDIVSKVTSDIRNKYCKSDRNINITTDRCSNDTKALSSESTQAVCSIISSMPQGIQSMNPDIKDSVETSVNWGMCELSQNTLHMEGLVRSQYNDKLSEQSDRIETLAKNNGASSKVYNKYPAWQFNETSPLRDKIKGVDAISFGPDIIDIHTPRERMDIESVGRIWKFLIRVLEEV